MSNQMTSGQAWSIAGIAFSAASNAKSIDQAKVQAAIKESDHPFRLEAEQALASLFRKHFTERSFRTQPRHKFEVNTTFLASGLRAYISSAGAAFRERFGKHVELNVPACKLVYEELPEEMSAVSFLDYRLDRKLKGGDLAALWQALATQSGTSDREGFLSTQRPNVFVSNCNECVVIWMHMSGWIIDLYTTAKLIKDTRIISVE